MRALERRGARLPVFCLLREPLAQRRQLCVARGAAAAPAAAGALARAASAAAVAACRALPVRELRLERGKLARAFGARARRLVLALAAPGVEVARERGRAALGSRRGGGLGAELACQVLARVVQVEARRLERVGEAQVVGEQLVALLLVPVRAVVRGKGGGRGSWDGGAVTEACG